MRKHNKWLHGKIEFVAPALPKDLRGRTGCLFQKGVFDSKVGDEIFLLILEDKEFSMVLSKFLSFNLFCKTGVARTDYGLVAFLVFSVYDGPKYVSAYELFLNPHNMETIRMLSSVGQQTHLKVILYDAEEDCLRKSYEFENVFGFQDFVGGLAQVIGNESEGDFSKAHEEFINKYTLEELLEL